MIRLIGPGGAGKSTIGALLAERLDVPFVDLDRHCAARIGDISEYIGRHGYDTYARENVEAYCSLFRGETRPDVVALSSGFMTYSCEAHPEYARVRREIGECAQTFVLLPSLDRELCVAETVRRQVARPFGRSPEREEAVIRARFGIYQALPTRKVETMRPAAAIVNEILAALSPANQSPSPAPRGDIRVL
jgi:shikimate kinase